MKLSYLTFKDKYAGIKATGDSKVALPKGSKAKEHMQRAFYLTAQLEAPIWGCVQSYDGCGMSGGPVHWVAVLPKNMEQGPLFSLLRRIEMVPGAPIKELWNAFAEKGWYVAKDGKLKYLKTGGVVHAKEIRNTFTPVDGLVPRIGKNRQEAEKWATLFYNLLSNPKTYEAQIDHSIKYLIEGVSTVEMKAYNLFLPTVRSPEVIITGSDLLKELENKHIFLPEELDLAMCVYHAFTPNAPAVAKACLETTLAVAGPKPDVSMFASNLIKSLGTKNYGRWKDVPGEKGSRYDATRMACIQSKLWSEEIIDIFLPKDFK
jgi:hypothetical protein